MICHCDIQLTDNHAAIKRCLVLRISRLSFQELGFCLGWYGHLMVLYKTKFNWVTWSPPKYVLPIIFS